MKRVLNFIFGAAAMTAACVVCTAPVSAQSWPTQRVTIVVRKGIYQELVYFRNKDNVTFFGEDRDATIVRYANSEVFNPHPANIRTNPQPGTFPSRRAAVAVDNSNDIHIVNMTLQTTSPGQAEGLLITSDGRVEVAPNDLMWQFR